MMPLHWNVVYGPIHSRRLGLSLGINLLPPDRKVCNFNCPYCQYGWSQLEKDGKLPPVSKWPTRESIIGAVGRELRHRTPQKKPLERLTFAGHGEPTLHPDFPAIVGDVRALRDELTPEVRIAILSNASTLEDPRIREALASIDERYMKLDAGDDTLLRRLNAATVPLDRLLDGLRGLPDVVIQAMFVKDTSGRIDNTGPDAVGRWLEAIRRVAPRAVQVYTIDRQPAFPFLRAVPRGRLDEIAQLVREAGFPAEVYV